MKQFNRIFSVLFLIFVSGCASLHTGEIENDKIIIQGANFSYIKTNVTGSSYVRYFLGIGGFGLDSLVHEAKKDLIKNNPLSSNQALANMVISYKYSTVFGIYIKRDCLITADIIEFKNGKN